MATTNHISTDVAVVPLLWIVPLALYLLTFIIAFDRPAWYWPILTAALTLVAIYPTSAIYKNNNVGWLKLYNCGMTGRCIQSVADFFTPKPQAADDEEAAEKAPVSPGPRVKIGFRTALFVNFAAMFGICMLCHGQLARIKPPISYLTAYYLMIAAGGALGGIAVSLIAPHVFNTIFEWRLAIFAAAVGAMGLILNAVVNRVVDPELVSPQWRPHSQSEEGRHTHDDNATNANPRHSKLWPRLLLIVLLVAFSFVLLDMVEYLFSMQKQVVYRSRNFFGALTIYENNPDDPSNREIVLLNGTTRHGAQFSSPQRRVIPTSYYSNSSGIGLVLEYFRANRPPGGIRVGDVGLGAGTLAAYAMKFDHICFYEINPTVIDLSTSGKWFTYVADARARGAHCDIKLGDARLTLQHELAADSPPRAGKGPGRGLRQRTAPLSRARARCLQRRRRSHPPAYRSGYGHLPAAPGDRSQHGRRRGATHPCLQPLP